MEAAGRFYIHHASRADWFRLCFTGDWHLMNPACHEELLKRELKEIKDDPFAFAVGMGDMADYISPRDKRFAADALSPDAKLNIGSLGKYGFTCVRDYLWPIKEKMFGLLYGNHERSYMIANNQEDLHSWLCTELGLPNFRYCALFDVIFCALQGKARPRKPFLSRKPPKHNTYTAETFRVCVHHGYGGAATASGKLMTFNRFMATHDADIYAMGHVHQEIPNVVRVMGADSVCGKIEEFDRIGTISGAYLKTYQSGMTSYGEMKGYQPTKLDMSSIRLKPHTREFVLEMRGGMKCTKRESSRAMAR